jgi:hypothetical protein
MRFVGLAVELVLRVVVEQVPLIIKTVAVAVADLHT